MRLYPWTPKEYRTRNQGQIDASRAELKRCSTELQIQPSTLVGSSGHTNKSACLGMFAKKNILPGDVVLSAPALPINPLLFDALTVMQIFLSFSSLHFLLVLLPESPLLQP